MTKEELINRFKEILRNEYGKRLNSDITVTTAIEVIEQIYEEL